MRMQGCLHCSDCAQLSRRAFNGALLWLVSGRQAAAKPAFSWSDTIFARGINLPSASFNDKHIPGVYARDYIYPSAKDLGYYAQKGFAVLRLPYRWERLQHSLFDPLDDAELGRIKKVLVAARALKMRVILSPHNFGRYPVNGLDTLIGTSGMPIEAFADFSHKVAAAFAGDDAIYGLSLMNEPHDSDGMWKETAQAGLDAIRSADPGRLVLAPGDQWSAAYKWREYNEDFLLNDPMSRVMYEAHQYFDADNTGTYKVGYTLSGATPDRGVERLRPFVDWLKQRRQRGILTEFGVPNDDPRWLELLRPLLVYLAREKIPWTYWAGGPWLGNYPLSVEPKNGVDAPAMAVLTQH
jgi:aryl-phospho-beta-D-glucosidase BglC (GH1 family)